MLHSEIWAQSQRHLSMLHNVMHRCKLWLCNVKFPVRRRQRDRLVRADGHWFAERRTTATETWQASGEHVLYNVAFVLRFTPQPAAQSKQEKKNDTCRAQRQKWHPEVWGGHIQRGRPTFALSENEGAAFVLSWTKRFDRKRKRQRLVSFWEPLELTWENRWKKGQTQRPKTNRGSCERSPNCRELKDGGQNFKQELKKAAQGDYTPWK